MDDYFFGYYYKCQSPTQTIALIAATHGAGSNRSCSIQAITEKGSMVRTIHESAECKAEYEFWIDDKQVFRFVTDKATFEYEY